MVTWTQGTLIDGRYRIVRPLGEGAFGEVFLACRVDLPDRLFALKTLKQANEKVRQRFIREVKILLDLVHQNIIAIRDFNARTDPVYYAMEYVDGPSLGTLLAKEGPLAPERAIRRVREVLQALGAAHHKGIVHRDMKPDNVLVAACGTPDEHAKVCDFGIAHLASEARLHLTQGAAGTPIYMAPEQADSKIGAVDARTDIYAVGCMLFELLTGRPPFVADSFVGYVTQHRIEPVPALAAVAPGRSFPAGIEAALRSALEKEPGKRYASAAEFAAVLDAAGRPVAAESRHSALAPPAPSIDWSAPLQGQTVGRYRIERVLGEGRLGPVVEGFDPTLSRRAAIKLLRPEIAQEAGFAERLQAEAQRLLTLDHPGIVQIYEAGAGYLAMELLRGETLADRLAREPRLPPAELARLLRPAFAAVAAAHARGIVHRDLRPGNIFLLDDGRTKVLGFGMATVTREFARTGHGESPGTVAYVSPEQARGHPLDGRSDVYALGVILFEALTGRRPFEGKEAADLLAAHVAKPPPRLADVRPDAGFGEGIEAVVARALAKNPEDRFAGALDLAAAFAAAVAAASPIEPAHGVPVPGGLPPTRVVGARARVDLPAGTSADGVTTVFVIAASVLRLGRAKPGQTPGHADNTLVARVLPCAGPDRYPENYQATRAISGSHLTIEERDGAAWLTDHSARGTTIDDVPAPPGTAVRLPPRFRLCLGGVLTLEGRLYPEHPDAARPIEAILLRRRESYAHHAYLWVRRTADLGEGLGRVEATGEELRFYLAPGLAAKPSPVAEEARDEEA